MTPEDFPLLAAWMVELPLFQRYGLAVSGAVASFAAGLARGDWLLTADEDAERACGFAWVMPGGAFGRSPYLRLIGVRADRAGGGLGAALLADVERRAAEVAADLFLLVSDFNEGAQRFYRRAGYQQVGSIPGYVLPDVAELIYRKRLK
jgi:GNAT superfamily N-acetyltransferase